MEIIRIPQVSLVDATGKRIGVYTDDPDWWQQLKMKNKNNDQLAITDSKTVNELESIDSASSSQMGSRTNLIKEKKSKDKNQLIVEDINAASNELAMKNTNVESKTADLTPSVPKPIDENSQCNVIGETPLHIAIMYNDFETIKYLIETKGFNVNQRSTGGKFVGGFNSKSAAALIQQSKYEGLAYYGEYPLAFASCFASKEIYDYLIDNGADANLQDTYGNTVLHVLVINNKLDMFQYATNHQKNKALLTIKNSQDLTPVNLAAKLGRKDLFAKMLELRTMIIWRYSNITCSTYPLEGLDTVDAQGKIAWNAALSYVVNGYTEDHLDMLEIGVVKRLLEDKWSTYAQRRLFQRLALSTIHLICLSIAIYTRASDYKNLSVWPPTNGATWVRYITEIVVLIGCLAILSLHAMEIYGQGFIYFLKNLKGEPANVFYILFCILILTATPFRFVSFQSESGITPRNVEDVLVILAIPCGWLHLLFYARVVTVTGPFVVMIYKMIIGDILTFASIYGFLLFGFSLGFYYLYKNSSLDTTSMNSYPEALMLSFQMTLGEFKARLPEFDKIYYSDFIKVVFIAFMILMHILLLNMLIAMMGNTYHQIIKKSEKEWRKQWAQIVILLERSFSPQDLRKFQDQYCIKLPSKDPNKKEDIVALMVIKKAPMTKAFQKISCITNWKRFSKNVLGLLKKHECTSAKLLEIWENKDKKVQKVKKEKDTKWLNYTNKGVRSGPSSIEYKEPISKKQATKPNLFSVKNNTVGVSNSDAMSKKGSDASVEATKKSSLNQFNVKDDTKKQQQTELQTKHQPLVISSSSSASSSGSNTTDSRLTSASTPSNSAQLPDSGVSATTPVANSNGSFVVVRDVHKKTFFPNQMSKIYPVVTSASSVNPEVVDADADSADDEENYMKRLDLTGAILRGSKENTTFPGPVTTKSTIESMRRPTHPRFPQTLHNESSDSDLLRNIDLNSDTSSIDLMDSAEHTKKS